MRYQNYRRKKFKEWKQRVANHLPTLVICFYAHAEHKAYEKHTLLGKVIKEINNPFYAIQDEWGKRLSSESEMADEIILEMQVNELFSYIQSLYK